MQASIRFSQETKDKNDHIHFGGLDVSYIVGLHLRIEKGYIPNQLNKKLSIAFVSLPFLIERQLVQFVDGRGGWMQTSNLAFPRQ